MGKNDFNQQGLTIAYPNVDGSGTVLEGGSHAWRNNNPGNIMNGPGHFAMQHGGLGYDSGGYAIFPDANMGENAQRDLLITKTYQGRTLKDMVDRYSKTDRDAYLNFLTRGMGGVSKETKLSDLNHYQFERLLKLMQQFEGNKPGTVSDWAAPKPGDNASPAPKLNLRKTFSPDLEHRSRIPSGGGSGDETLERRGEEVFRITGDVGGAARSTASSPAYITPARSR